MGLSSQQLTYAETVAGLLWSHADLDSLKRIINFGAEKCFGEKGILLRTGHASTFTYTYLWLAGLPTRDDRNVGEKIATDMNMSKEVTPGRFYYSRVAWKAQQLYIEALKKYIMTADGLTFFLDEKYLKWLCALSAISDFDYSSHFEDIITSFLAGFASNPALMNANRNILVKNIKIYPGLFSKLKEYSQNIDMDENLNILIFQDGKFHVGQDIFCAINDSFQNIIIKEGVVTNKLGKLYSVKVDSKVFDDVDEKRLFMKMPNLGVFIGLYETGDHVQFFAKQKGYHQVGQDLYVLTSGIVQKLNKDSYNIYVMNDLFTKFSNVLYFEEKKRWVTVVLATIKISEPFKITFTIVKTGKYATENVSSDDIKTEEGNTLSDFLLTNIPQNEIFPMKVFPWLETTIIQDGMQANSFIKTHSLKRIH